MRNASTSSAASPMGRRLLSQTAEHALRAVLYLARRQSAELVSAGEVAAALGTPPNYTSKTLRQLTRKGVLRSVRGPRGGFALRVDPSTISVALIADAVDEVAEPPAVCLLGDRACDAEEPCEAHRRWMDVRRRVSALLVNTTLADLLVDESAGIAARSA